MATQSASPAADAPSERSRIVDEIWGTLSSAEASKTRLDSLTMFLGQYERERQTARRLSPSLPTSNADIQGYIRLLKTGTTRRKLAIRGVDAREAIDAQTEVQVAILPRDEPSMDGHWEDGPKSPRASRTVVDEADSTTETDRQTDRPDKEALHLAVRITYLTACVTPGRWTTTGQGIFRPTWKDTESLAEFMSRVYPRAQPPQESLRINVGKFSAAYLERYASIRLRWTDRLSDHLTFMKGGDWKSLYVFAHPAWLKAGLDTLEKDDIDLAQTTERALELGCLPPHLLRETFLTLHLLFPASTAPTPTAAFSSSRSILAREIAQNGLDPYFTYLFTDCHLLYRDYHTHPAEASSPTSLHGLYARFPYWGDRLEALWREADDPSPVTGLGHWAESRRNPRFGFWCAFVGICVALAFGIVGTVLAALQVWLK